MDGAGNTASGFQALFRNTSSTANTASGFNALYSNTDGSGNTANGFQALLSNTSGSTNTASGVNALRNNTTGDDNTATGSNALQSNQTGFGNTANGVSALLSNIIGFGNTASGFDALMRNTRGSSNTADGAGALFQNTLGSQNTANGLLALSSNTEGGNNTANGWNALLHNTTGNNNIALGSNAGSNLTTGSNNVDIGNAGVAGKANTIRIGTSGTQKSTFIAGISGVAVTGSQVVVNATGKLGVATSSARFKQAIKPMDKASEAILALKPVTFRYKEEIDPDGIPQFGLIAEEVEKVNSNLVARDAEGKINTVRYEAVNAMLLNEFLKEHPRAEEQRKYFEAKFVQQQNQIEALSTGLQKVSAQFELSKSASRTVSNNQ